MRKHIEVVLPVWNELPNIQPLVDALDTATVELRSRYRFSYLFVNDGSTDGSRAAIQTLCEQRDDIRAVHLIHNFGHAAAIRCGLTHAVADAVVLMDADMQDSPEALPEMLARWAEGAKTVVAARGRREGRHQWPFRLFYFLLRRLSPGHPPFGTFCLLDRQVIERLLTLNEDSRYFPALVSFASDSIATVQVDRKARAAGASRVGKLGLLNLAVTAFLDASAVPIRLATLLGFVTSLIAVAAIVAIAGVALFSDRFVPAWVPITTTVLFASGVQLLSIGVIGEYVARIYRELKRRPAYFVDSTDASHHHKKVA